MDLVSCPSCGRTLRAPPNAPRFRCVCNQILQRPPPSPEVQPPNNSSPFYYAYGTDSSSNSGSVPTASARPLPPSSQRSSPTEETTAARPLASTLQRPPPTQETTAAPQRVRCPQCSSILIPPVGSPLFRCTCGLTLRSPKPTSAPLPQRAPSNRFNNGNGNTGTTTTTSPNLNGSANVSTSNRPTNTASSSTASTRNGAATLARTIFGGIRSRMTTSPSQKLEVVNHDGPRVPGSQMKETPRVEDTRSPDEVIAATVGAKKAEYWLRNMATDGKLYWVRLLSEEEEEKIRKLLSTWETDMKTRIEELEIYDLRVRMEQLQWEEKINCDDKKLMKEALLNAKTIILANSNANEVILLLNNLNVDHTACVSFAEYVERLLAAVWYGPRRLCDGFVRDFIGEFDLTMIPAQQFGLPLDYKKHKISSDEIERMTQKPFKEKVAWLKDLCEKSRIPWETGRVELKIKREDILQDSFYKLRTLKPDDFKKIFKFEFMGEVGIDAGGLSREWFELVMDACFNVDCGLFEYSGVDNICYQFNPSSGIANDLHEEYFRFVGRVIGKALFDQKYLNAHLTQPIFKHILGYPVTVEDIQYCDQKLYDHLKELESTEDDISAYMLTFSVTHEVFGEVVEVALKPGGGDIVVTNANVQEYIMLITKYFMLERTKTQLSHFLRGIYDVIPELWLSIFDYRELELLLCGLPNINVLDWKNNTKYKGNYTNLGPRHKVIQWFWQYVEEGDQERRAKLLQFCTGTSRVPVAGFSALQGRSGQVTPFTIEAVSLSKFVYPRAHTCFNRIDLPEYQNKVELYRRLEEACSISMTGFNDE